MTQEVQGTVRIRVRWWGCVLDSKLLDLTKVILGI